MPCSYSSSPSLSSHYPSFPYSGSLCSSFPVAHSPARTWRGVIANTSVWFHIYLLSISSLPSDSNLVVKYGKNWPERHCVLKLSPGSTGGLATTCGHGATVHAESDRVWDCRDTTTLRRKVSTTDLVTGCFL